ncbi:MAG: DEAD/DEAH box helicase [bacterium]|nr:DEAD/DEAH box helicase [bacterium]
MPPAPAPPDSDIALAAFNRTTRAWFEARFGAPTQVQSLAWPRIAAGEHVLATAPTGSGKTLAAFLWSLDRLLSGAWEGGYLRVLYISPLKALNNDIQRNLLVPLAELDRAFSAAGREDEPVRVAVRSGDTPAAERRKMLRTPPEILITTPESLNILLTSPRGKKLFTGLETVILDEIHAVAGSKRGTHLITAVDRLVDLAGEFQRVALSATVKPLAEMARFVGGYRLSHSGGEAVYTPRAVAMLEAAAQKRYDLRVCRPEGLEPRSPAGEEALSGEPPANLWEALITSLRSAIEANRSTLLFANSRRTTEKVTRLLNEGSRSGAGGELAYSHHGSLSRELRAVVEQRLKEGRLRAIVATNSLELGIDIGSLDEVLLVQTPPTIASAVQRVGRAGHAVGETAKARLYPFQGRDLVQAAVMARCVLEHDIEEVKPVRCALDVLAQVILSMTAGRTWSIDRLFDRIRASHPYRQLSRRRYDLVVEMLAGRYADSRVRELEPRLAFDRLDGTLRARRGVERYLYVAGGTIPDRGYFQLRHHESLAKLGELDEEFVWERSLGDTFTLGAQAWRIRKITHSDVLASPSRKGSAFAPFWRAEERNRSYHLSERIGEFLERADSSLATRNGSRDLQEELVEKHAMEPAAAAEVIEFLERQRSAAGFVPHRHRLLLEKLPEDDAGDGRRTWILHTGWGGRVNRPLALVLPVAARGMLGESLETDASNDSLLITAGERFDLSGLLARLAAQPLESLLKRSLEATGLFGARFRENAGRALLLPRSNLKRRVPLWLQRERAKKLLATVARYGDFPIVVETWRTCLEDMFDLESLKAVLQEIERGEVRLDEVATSEASPFAADMMWRATNRLMYDDDSPRQRGSGALSDSVLREVVFSAELRPRFAESLLTEFEGKLQRTHPGYAPRDALELVEWVKERWLVPEREWRALLEAGERDAAARADVERTRSVPGDPDPGEPIASFRAAVAEASAKLVRLRWQEPAVCARERLAGLTSALGEPAEVRQLAGDEALGAQTDAGTATVEVDQIFTEWIRYYGPVSESRARRSLGLTVSEFEGVAGRLVEQGLLVVDRFRRGSEEVELCDAENLERLLRIQRARSRPRLEARPIAELPLLLAARQGLLARGGDHRDLKRSLDRLIGYPAPARLWESEILPARLDPYYPAWLDSLFQETDFLWLGCGKERLCFAFPEEVGLVRSVAADPEPGEPVLPNPYGRFRFEEIARHRGESLRVTAELLWKEAWRGVVSNTTFGAVRQGAASRFVFDERRLGANGSTGLERSRRATRPPRRPSRRPSLDRWRPKAFYTGDWFAVDGVVSSLDDAAETADALDRLETDKDRVRLLLDRYGILFRELLARETAAFSWSGLFRTLRLMELSGEIVAGHFFEGIAGLQFAAHDAVRLLRDGLPADAVYWMNAADPASPAGLGLEDLKGTLPARIPSNHLVFHGSRLVIVSRGNGGRLEIAVAPDHPDLERYLGFLKNLLTRRSEPLRAIDLTEINGSAAAESSYAPRIREIFQATREGAKLRLRRRYAAETRSI